LLWCFQQGCAHAGATQVNIIVKEGGNKLLQIQDNGHGIHVRPFWPHRKLMQASS